MSEAAAPVEIILRIPGQWAHPGELMERLPEGHRLTPEGLILPDGTAIQFGGLAADGQFAEIFRTSCRQAATPEELAVVKSYTVNFCLSGPGGSLEAARRMMQAGAAVVRAGGAGVFVDNSVLAHGGRHWLQMSEDGGPDATSFAFVAIVSGRDDVFTMGMHVLGLRDLLMKRVDADAESFGIIDVIRYLARGEKPVDEGHVLADVSGPRFRAFVQDSPRELARGPMHNPFGRLKLVSMRDLAEKN